MPLIIPAIAFVLILVLGLVPRFRSNSWLFASVLFLGSGAVLSSLWWDAVQWDFGFPAPLLVDALARWFLLLVFGVGCAVALYAGAYMKGMESLPKFFASLAAFQLGMVGIATSQDWLSLVVFWELTSIASFFLISYHVTSKDAQAGAVRALLVTGLGGLALVFAALCAWGVSGEWSFVGSALAVGADSLVLKCVVGGVFFAALTKSAQFPFQFWLPGAMAAPTPVSAYLHSATLVKAGVLLLLKMWPIFGDFQLWSVLVVVGLVTYFCGAFLACLKTDLKELLAYSTISQLGLMVTAIGIASPLAFQAVLLHVLAHGLFKAPLFMVAGIVDHETGTRDLQKLRHLGGLMPITRWLALFSLLSAVGFPFFFGFVSKELILKMAKADSLAVFFALGVGAVLGLVYSLKFFSGVFGWGWLFGQVSQKSQPSHEVHDPSWGFWLGPAVLVALGIVLGLVPQVLTSSVLSVLSLFGFSSGTLPVELRAWFGVDLVFLLSAASIGLGVFLFWGLSKQHRFFRTLESRPLPRFAQGFDALTQRLIHAGSALGSAVQGQSLPFVLSVVVLALGLWSWAIGAPLGLRTTFQEVARAALLAWEGFSPSTFESTGLLVFSALTLISTLSVVLMSRQKRWASIFVLSACGSGVIGLFYFLGAPDLALTQAAIEVTTLALFAVMIFQLKRRLGSQVKEPELRDETKSVVVYRVFAAVVAAVLGAFVSFLALAPGMERVASKFYSDHSLVPAGGRNIVNVILVDFRGFDTLGEISVLAAAAVGVLALLHGLGHRPWERRTPHSFSPWMSNAFGPWFALVMLFSVYLTLRGHNLPGGGFVGGLVMALGLLCLKMYWPQALARKSFSGLAFALMGWGYLVALVSTWIPSLWGDAVFRSYKWGHVFATASFFDWGLALLVCGVTLYLVDDRPDLVGAHQ